MTDIKTVTDQILKIVEGEGTAKESGRKYYFVDILINDLQITRIFPKDTERSYFKSLIGQYLKMTN